MFTPQAVSTTSAISIVSIMVSSGVANAWVESPLQLLCAVEYAFATHTPARIVPRSGALQLQRTAERLRELDLPTGVS
ncbi:MAG: hypothetical protein ABUL47_05485, partial [Leifsonia sp.]